MPKPNIASLEDWKFARKALLKKEKEFMRLRDEISRDRRALPWVEIDKHYELESASGKHALAELFGQHSQLIVYHFMMGESWDEGCPSCSLWADGFDGNVCHFAARDAAFAVVSSASTKKIEAYKKRMQWRFDWYSCLNTDFNNDMHVSFTKEQIDNRLCEYNYQSSSKNTMDELPGVSIFVKNQSGTVYHTYSTYSRGLDNLNVVYQYLDLLPNGRDEDNLDFSMAWVRRHDEY